MLRNLGIRSKLLALIAVPTMLLVGVALILIVQARGEPARLAVLSLALMALSLTIVLSIVLLSRMVGPLERLTGAAIEFGEALPGMIDRLSIAGGADGVSVEPVPVESRDEVGKLATAFNSVTETTIRVAHEQAALRAGIAEMFVNVARRNQVLLGRQLAFIDQLEQNEENPDQLENLFRLDHLATRMRRNAESLLVLAGIDGNRKLRRPMPLSDVVRTAASEIEQYGRVDLAATPFDPPVSGRLALTAAHLIAELLENATHFSNPDTRVVVTVFLAEDGVRVVITDAGLGMSSEEVAAYNQVIANPPAEEIAVAQRLGFYVVGRLAQRLEATAFLRQTDAGGIAVEVRLPAALFDGNAVPQHPPVRDEASPAPGPVSAAPVVHAAPAPAPAAAPGPWSAAAPVATPSPIRAASPAPVPASPAPEHAVAPPAVNEPVAAARGRSRFGRKRPPAAPAAPAAGPRPHEPAASPAPARQADASPGSLPSRNGTGRTVPSVPPVDRLGADVPEDVAARLEAPAAPFIYAPAVNILPGRSGGKRSRRGEPATFAEPVRSMPAATTPVPAPIREPAPAPASPFASAQAPAFSPAAPVASAAPAVPAAPAALAAPAAPAAPDVVEPVVSEPMLTWPSAPPAPVALSAPPATDTADNGQPDFGGTAETESPARPLLPSRPSAAGAMVGGEAPFHSSHEEMAAGAQLASAALAELSWLSNGYEPEFRAAPKEASASNGLTRRTARHAAPAAVGAMPAAPAKPRDATQVRGMLSGFRAGVERGRTGPEGSGVTAR